MVNMSDGTDIEMSFVEEKDVMAITERLLIKLTEALAPH